MKIESDFFNSQPTLIDRNIIGNWKLLGISDGLYSDIVPNNNLEEIANLTIKQNDFCTNCDVFADEGKTFFKLGDKEPRLDCEYIIAEDANQECLDERERLYVFIINSNIKSATLSFEDMPSNFDDFANYKPKRKTNLPKWLLECEKNVGKILIYARL